MNADAQITLVMSEQAPLEIFGWRAAEMMRAELEHANVHLELDASVGTVEGSSGELVLGPSSRRLTANGVLALPGLRGRTPHGIPQDAEGFVDADGLGRVRGIEGVWAAGGWHRLPSEVRRPRRPAGRRGRVGLSPQRPAHPSSACRSARCCVAGSSCPSAVMSAGSRRGSRGATTPPSPTPCPPTAGSRCRSTSTPGKLSQHFCSTGEMAGRLDEAGADGLVLFKPIPATRDQPETLAVVGAVGLSRPAEARLPRTWIALLHGRVRASLAGDDRRRRFL